MSGSILGPFNCGSSNKIFKVSSRDAWVAKWLRGNIYIYILADGTDPPSAYHPTP